MTSGTTPPRWRSSPTCRACSSRWGPRGPFILRMITKCSAWALAGLPSRETSLAYSSSVSSPRCFRCGRRVPTDSNCCNLGWRSSQTILSQTDITGAARHVIPLRRRHDHHPVTCAMSSSSSEDEGERRKLREAVQGVGSQHHRQQPSSKR